MSVHLAPNSLLAKLNTQPRVRDFLARAVMSGRASHAYLFLGSPGSGKLDAAWALAQALLCSQVPATSEGAAAGEGPATSEGVAAGESPATREEYTVGARTAADGAPEGPAGTPGSEVPADGAFGASHNWKNSEESQSFSSYATVGPATVGPATVGPATVGPATVGRAASGHGACAACDDCARVARRTHPDVHYFAPESATGYLIAQTRELLEDVSLAPIRARAKVYIIDRAEQLRANTANALLKTLEEPPANVTFILLGTSPDVVLPTIVSRCQCVPFRPLSPDESTVFVEHATGLPAARCRMAVAVAGSPARAVEFLKSAERQATRRAAVRAIDALARADEADILASAKELTLAAKAPLQQIEEAQKEMLEQNQDYLSRGALKQLEDRNKRELNARERSGIMEALASVRSLLRDALIAREGAPVPPVNEDVADVVERLAARASTAGVTAALDAVAATEHRIARNVTPQLALEVMLFDIRKALKCP